MNSSNPNRFQRFKGAASFELRHRIRAGRMDDCVGITRILDAALHAWLATIYFAPVWGKNG